VINESNNLKLFAMEKEILESVKDAVTAVQAIGKPDGVQFLIRVCEEMRLCLQRRGKILIAGNGGSLCDAMHFAEELTGLFRKKRRPYAALALTDPGHITCVANDIGFREIYARLIESLGREEDIFVALTTSGNSENLVRAAEAAKEKKIPVIGFLGRGGGALKDLCDFYWIVEGFTYSDRIQEAHMTALHILIGLLERHMMEEAVEIRKQALVG
jgi:D-sedoheptulose 7-phosphate isomerase